jgi:hypothetical protein
MTESERLDSDQLIRVLPWLPFSDPAIAIRLFCARRTAACISHKAEVLAGRHRSTARAHSVFNLA